MGIPNHLSIWISNDLIMISQGVSDRCNPKLTLGCHRHLCSGPVHLYNQYLVFRVAFLGQSIGISFGSILLLSISTLRCKRLTKVSLFIQNFQLSTFQD